VDRADPTLTNLDTGTSYLQRTAVEDTETYDPETNTFLDVSVGRSFDWFSPGDQGPFGEVGANGALFAVVGYSRVTTNADTGQITSFSLVGTATDLCPILAA
jgi:hypothetical protein